MKGDRLHLPYNLSTNHKNAVDFFEELCIIEKEANSVSAKLFFRTCKVFFGRRGRIWKDNLTDEVSLGSQSRAWLAPCPFCLKRRYSTCKNIWKNKTNETVLRNTYSSDELGRFSKSDYRWADNRTKPFRHKAVKKGEIYQFEFGKNFIPEMSYEHRGLVIGVKQKLLYVLPIFPLIRISILMFIIPLTILIPKVICFYWKTANFHSSSVIRY